VYAKKEFSTIKVRKRQRFKDALGLNFKDSSKDNLAKGYPVVVEKTHTSRREFIDGREISRQSVEEMTTHITEQVTTYETRLSRFGIDDMVEAELELDGCRRQISPEPLAPEVSPEPIMPSPENTTNFVKFFSFEEEPKPVLPEIEVPATPIVSKEAVMKVVYVTATPNILCFVCDLLVIGTVNLVMIGHAPGSDAAVIAAEGLGTMIQDGVALSCFSGFTNAFDIFVSQAWGAGNPELACQYFNKGRMLTFFIWLMMIPVFIFAEPILLFLGQEAEVSKKRNY
jgi:hypothetical protein